MKTDIKILMCLYGTAELIYKNVLVQQSFFVALEAESILCCQCYNKAYENNVLDIIKKNYIIVI